MTSSHKKVESSLSPSCAPFLVALKSVCPRACSCPPCHTHPSSLQLICSLSLHARWLRTSFGATTLAYHKPLIPFIPPADSQPKLACKMAEDVVRCHHTCLPQAAHDLHMVSIRWNIWMYTVLLISSHTPPVHSAPCSLPPSSYPWCSAPPNLNKPIKVAPLDSTMLSMAHWDDLPTPIHHQIDTVTPTLSKMPTSGLQCFAVSAAAAAAVLPCCSM